MEGGKLPYGEWMRAGNRRKIDGSSPLVRERTRELMRNMDSPNRNWELTRELMRNMDSPKIRGLKRKGQLMLKW